MRIIKEATIRGFWREYPDAELPLRKWVEVAKPARWTSIQEVRIQFPHADAAQVASGKVVTIFNTRGNKYRLIVAIHYNVGLVFVLRIMTHAEYSKGTWKDSL